MKEFLSYKTATSYAGRDIYAIELLPKCKGYISRTKRINLLPSEIINSRHHANEVSSTNSAFILLKEILTNEKYKDLSEKLNLVIVPMENVDGTAIHYELQQKIHTGNFMLQGLMRFKKNFTMNILKRIRFIRKQWDLQDCGIECFRILL